MAYGKVMTSDGQVVAGPGKLVGVIATGSGLTAGDKIEFVDSLTATGTSKCTIVFNAAAATVDFTPAHPIAFGTGIYANFTLTGAGTATLSAVYE
jgi:hypothetical protein